MLYVLAILYAIPAMVGGLVVFDRFAYYDRTWRGDVLTLFSCFLILSGFVVLLSMFYH